MAFPYVHSKDLSTFKSLMTKEYLKYFFLVFFAIFISGSFFLSYPFFRGLDSDPIILNPDPQPYFASMDSLLKPLYPVAQYCTIIYHMTLS